MSFLMECKPQAAEPLDARILISWWVDTPCIDALGPMQQDIDMLASPPVGDSTAAPMPVPHSAAGGQLGGMARLVDQGRFCGSSEPLRLPYCESPARWSPHRLEDNLVQRAG
jgi:hypothetical protein